MLDKHIFEQSISEAKKGNEIAREKLICHYKPYIINTTGHLSKRYITWSDEEASVGLLAFNKAIDTYDVYGGRSFLNYAYLLIKRDLIDHYRRENRQRHLSINYAVEEKDNLSNQLEVGPSIESFHQVEQSKDLVEEILELDSLLNSFDISFEELEQHSPQHTDTRKTLFEMANKFATNQELVQILLVKKRFPVKPFALEMGYKVKTIERHRKYLITLIILKLNPQWVHLSQYIKESPRKEETQ